MLYLGNIQLLDLPWCFFIQHYFNYYFAMRYAFLTLSFTLISKFLFFYDLLQALLWYCLSLRSGQFYYNVWDKKKKNIKTLLRNWISQSNTLPLFTCFYLFTFILIPFVTFNIYSGEFITFKAMAMKIKIIITMIYK